MRPLRSKLELKSTPECGVPITVPSLHLLLILCLISGLFSASSVAINVLKKVPLSLSAETQVIECELVNMIIDLHNLLNLPLALGVRWRNKVPLDGIMQTAHGYLKAQQLLTSPTHLSLSHPLQKLPR
jgi:hypothetical protein